jgi:hypothetical protein
MVCIAVALAAMATLILSACGGGSSGGTEAPGGTEAVEQQTTTRASTKGGFAYGGSSPKGKGGKPAGSATIAAQFPEPKPQPGSPPGARKAIDAGRKACRGKTPEQVRDEFMAEAEAGGLLNSGQKKMLANLASYEKQAANTPDFVAGQLAAGVYEATLPEKLRISGYQGCVYELAQQLQKEIANGSK